MNSPKLKLAAGFHRLGSAELVLCAHLNQVAGQQAIRRVLALASRLGDGIVWYLLIMLLPLLYGTGALLASCNMITTGLVSLGVYKFLKGRTSRPRPFAVQASITPGADPLDQFSFPSGHTLHAVSFSVTATAYFPELGVVLFPLAALIACSRVLLGLHYPSDILAGAVLGYGIATLLLYP